MTQLLHVPEDHPLNSLPHDLKQKFRASQESLLDLEFSSAYELFARTISDLKVQIPVPAELRDQPPTVLGDQPHKVLVKLFVDALLLSGVPEQAVGKQGDALAQQLQLLRAFKYPNEVVDYTQTKVAAIVNGFPANAADIRCGRNPGDVLDPYIFAAAQGLIYIDDFEGELLT